MQYGSWKRWAPNFYEHLWHLHTQSRKHGLSLLGTPGRGRTGLTNCIAPINVGVNRFQSLPSNRKTAEGASHVLQTMFIQALYIINSILNHAACTSCNAILDSRFLEVRGVFCFSISTHRNGLTNLSTSFSKWVFSGNLRISSSSLWRDLRYIYIYISMFPKIVVPPNHPF